MFAKGLAFRAFRIKAVKDLGKAATRYAGPLVAHLKAGRTILGYRDGKTDGASGGRKGHRIAKQVVENLNNSAILHHYWNLFIACREGQGMGIGCLLTGQNEVFGKVAHINPPRCL